MTNEDAGSERTGGRRGPWVAASEKGAKNLQMGFM